MSESKDKKFKDRLTYAYIRKMKRWMYCPNCREGKLRINKASTMWKCDECGYELSADEFEDDYVFWFCDGCGAYLNIQDGFNRNATTHTCTVCGFENDITEANIKGECQDCGKVLDNPNATLCPECRQKRIQTALTTTAVICRELSVILKETGSLIDSVNGSSNISEMDMPYDDNFNGIYEASDLRRVHGLDVKVSTDSTGGFISVDWHCPYCGAYNAGFYFTPNVPSLYNDFEIDHDCEECGKTVTIECENASELF